MSCPNCNVTCRQGGRKEQIEVVRTQVAAMNRVAEMLEYIEELADATPEVKTLMKKKVVELEKERQYEERVMAGRLNASNTSQSTVHPSTVIQMQDLKADMVECWYQCSSMKCGRRRRPLSRSARS